MIPRQEDLSHFIVESASDFAIFTMDQAGAVTSWNTGAERMFGYPEMQIVGTPGDVIFTPEDRRSGVPQREREEATTKGRAEDDRWHQRANGTRFWATGLLMPLRSPMRGYVKIARDRTDHHEADVRLQESEERFRLLATSIPQLVFRSLPDGTRTWGSQQWIDFTGLDLERSLDYGWMDAIHPEDREATRQAWTEARQKGEYYVEHRVRLKATGEYRWHQTRARPIRSDDTIPGDWMGTMTDIHQIRQLQERQQVMLAELHHRTRNLLTVIQAISMQLARSSSSKEAFLDALLTRLAALSRAQGLIARAQQSHFPLRDLIETELSAHLSGATEERQVHISGDDAMLPIITMQALALAVHELATNALKYGALATPTGRISISWREIGDQGPPHVLFEWKETGVNLVQKPVHKGYGSTLIETALPRQLQTRTSLELEQDGMRCIIELPLNS